MPEKLKKQFQAYKEIVKSDSPLYHFIADKISEDEKYLTQLKSYAVDASFIPLFFTAVLKSLYIYEDDLREYYLNFMDKPKAPDDRLLHHFKAFTNRYMTNISQDIRRYDLKKNIVERSSALIPIFTQIIKSSGHEHFNMIELGTRAGLLLNYDWYGYTFNKSVVIGDTEKMNIKVRINQYDSLDKIEPLVHPNQKIGITRNKMDITTEEDHLWLLSLYYPEENKRRKYYNKARKLFLEHPVDIYEGEEIQLLDEQLSVLPEDEPIIIFHIHVTKHWSDERKQQLLAVIQKHAQSKEIYHVHHQIFNSDIYLDSFFDGNVKREKLAHFDLNKLQIEWLFNQPIKL